MLRSVLGDYLDGVKEREFDLPLVLLLPAMGFFDVHLIHGAVEFGKDVIAKKEEGAGAVQYVFQSKAGDIGHAAWRNEVQGQLLEATINTLAHPSFDAGLPRQVVLVTTGVLNGNARLAMQAFNHTLQHTYRARPVVLWEKPDLVDLLLAHGLDGVHRATATGFDAYARFFIVYAQALDGTITDREIERHSRLWSGPAVDRGRRLLLCAVESEVLAERCAGHGLAYEAAHLHLAGLRLLCELAYEDVDTPRLRTLFDLAAERLHARCASYVEAVRDAWSGERNLLKTWFGEPHVNSYPVACARVMELASLSYFTAAANEDRDLSASFLDDFVRHEPGCAHPIGDRSAVSLVLAVLVLLETGRCGTAAGLIERATVWVCDRYEAGMGLAGVEADEVAETNLLLGYPFEAVDAPRRWDSLLATALMDLAAFLGDPILYGAVVNDFKACRVHPEYWQPQDTAGSCRIDGEDVLNYPSVGFADELAGIGDRAYAEHMPHEPSSFRFVERYGPSAAVAVMALLRDRYFPGLWPRMVPNRRPVTTPDADGPSVQPGDDA